MYLIGSDDFFHPEHGYICLGETIFILQMEPPELWSRTHSFLYIGEDFVMHFGHHMLF
jgi:hypothetical protein